MSWKDVGSRSFVSYAQFRFRVPPTYYLYRFRNYYVLHIPGLFDREFPEAVLKIAKFIQAQLKLNVRKYKVIIIS